MTAAVKMPPEFTDPERLRGPQDVPNDLFGVTWDSDEDPQNPRNWSELQNYVQSTLVVSIFMLGFAAGPLVISPLSEEYGRNIVFISTVILHLVFTIACALSTSINMLIVFRFIAGCFGSAPITIGGGTITDIMPQGKRGKAMAIFIMGPTLGPSFGPVIGGYLAQAAGWRWVFWLLAITLGVMMAFTLICLKETYAPKILAQKARNLRKETGNQCWRSKLQIDLSARQLLLRAIVRPSKLLVLSPIVLSLSIYMATSYGYLFLLFTTFPTVFQDHYRFSIGKQKIELRNDPDSFKFWRMLTKKLSGTIGLVYIAIGVGLAAGQVILFYTSDRLMAQHEIEC
ncbi:MAG: hypothetical protein LQ338_003861, partial [Usnochroma carphineum]